MTPAIRLRERLRADLKHAMKDGRRPDANLIRTLIAAIDNAEAVALPDDHKPATTTSFASGASEAARRVLDQVDLAAILEQEIAARRDVAAQIATGGAAEHAARLETEAGLVAAYLAELRNS